METTPIRSAIAGGYAKGSLKELPAGILESWFYSRNGLWILDERVKRLVRFERHNLLADRHPKRWI